MKNLAMTASVLAMITFATTTYASGDDDDNRGPQGEQGIQGPAGPAGQDGEDGEDGEDGRDGVSFDYDRYMNGLSSTAALGGLELRTPVDGVWTYGVGLGGVMNEGDNAEAVSAGIRYGVNDASSLYGKVSRSLGGNSTAWYVGFESQF